MFYRINLPKSSAWYVTLGLLLTLSVSYSDDFVAPVTVTNRTAYYLHVNINKDSFSYLAPGGAIHTSVSTHSATIQAVYSPGQEVSGKFAGNYSTATVNSYGDGALSCRNGQNSCSSTTESRTTTTPNPVAVEIFPALMR
jgi:hypothetical protein